MTNEADWLFSDTIYIFGRKQIFMDDFCLHVLYL